MLRGEHADVVLPDTQPLPGRDRDEAHRRVGRHPHPARLDDLRWTEYVERLVADPRAEEQERRGAVVGVLVRDQDVAQPAEVDARTFCRARCLRAAVEQEATVDEGRGLAPHAAFGTF